MPARCLCLKSGRCRWPRQVRASLAFATSPRQVEYLLNLSRFAARHPEVDVPYGTTRNEAAHNQLKSFYRNVLHQTGRNAQMVAAVCTSAKLLAGWMQRIPNLADVRREEHEVLRYALSSIAGSPPDLTVRPRMRGKTRHNPSVDENALPQGAKRLRRS